MPTPYPDVNSVLRELLSGVQAVLGERFAGMYLYGSLAQGDFTPDRSDIDFVVVTREELAEEQVAALRSMHERIAAGDSHWAKELEGSYVPLSALRRYERANAQHPHIGRGDSLRVEQHDSDWVIQRHIVREYGVTLAGPPPRTLIDPVSRDDLLRAVREIVSDWWAPMLDDPSPIEQPGYQPYAVLTMCRVLYTLAYGTVVSKPVAARRALETLDERWSDLIRHALEWRNGDQTGNMAETLDFIRYTVERCQVNGKRET